MRFAQFFTLLGLTFIGCNKDKVPESLPPMIGNYQSEGDFLILVVGDTLESAYEYNLSTIQLNNDSLPLMFQVVSQVNSMYSHIYAKMLPNPDTLFWIHANTTVFVEDEISSNNLFLLSSTLGFDASDFQIVDGTLGVDLEYNWGKISSLEIVNEFRASSPNAKIGVVKHVMWVYDEQLEFSVPE